MKEQIEEMALIMCGREGCKTCTHFIDATKCAAVVSAKKLYKADYRKQKEGENISQMHPSDEFICEKCGLIIRECCRYEIDEDDGDEICYEFPYRFCPRCGMKVKGGAE
jgi:hypothetical protein